MKFRNILVVADHKRPGSAVRRAVKLARPGGRVSIMVVVQERGRVDSRLLDHLVEETGKTLTTLANRAADETVEITTKVVLGHPVIDVVREVLREGHDLLVKMAEGAGARRGPLLGSDDKRLIRKCPCPVWVIASGSIRRFTRILAAVEADVEGGAHQALDRAVLQSADHVAKLDKGTLHVVHAWMMYGEAALRGPFMGMTEGELREALDDVRRHERAALEKTVAAALPGEEPKTHLIKGRPAEAIANCIEKHRIQLLVIGTVGRTGIPGLIVGNTAERVMNEIDCSVLALKPEGYVSPVKL